MSILMFSGMRKQILSFVLETNIVKSIFMQIYVKKTDVATNIVLADRFFSCFDYAWLVPLW